MSIMIALSFSFFLSFFPSLLPFSLFPLFDDLLDDLFHDLDGLFLDFFDNFFDNGLFKDRLHITVVMIAQIVLKSRSLAIEISQITLEIVIGAVRGPFLVNESFLLPLVVVVDGGSETGQGLDDMGQGEIWKGLIYIPL